MSQQFFLEKCTDSSGSCQCRPGSFDFAAASPNPNFNLLDRFLVMMGRQDVPVILCFNKCDLITEEQQQEIASIYEASGCKILFVSAKRNWD